MNSQDKYFSILHTSKKTPYTDGKTLIFTDLNSNFESESFEDIVSVIPAKAGIQSQSNLNSEGLDSSFRWNDKSGVLLCYLSYDLKNSSEKLPEDEDFFINTPRSWFGNFGKVEIKTDYQLPTTKYEPPNISYVRSNMSKAEYISKLGIIKNYIDAGDIYQANLTRKFYGEFSENVDPYEIYCQLNRISPAPYSAYLKIDDLHIISSSPELFIRVDNEGNAVTCPIKGSAAKGEGMELSKSIKDKAENLMITDLMRNDFSRSCIPGSVKVENLFEVSEFRTISHMYSTIVGKLEVGRTKPEFEKIGKNKFPSPLTGEGRGEGESFTPPHPSLLPQGEKEVQNTGSLANKTLELIKNCFPPGSMTGAPKIRAMEICSELEKHKRGIYSGALGYFNFNNDKPAQLSTICELSVVIRTIIIQGNKFEFQVGGGIVYDSDPEKEWQETMLKAQAMAEVLGVQDKIKNL